MQDVPEGINKDRQSHVMVLNKMDLLGGEAQAADAFDAQLGRCIDRLGRQETVGAGASFDAIMYAPGLRAPVCAPPQPAALFVWRCRWQCHRARCVDHD